MFFKRNPHPHPSLSEHHNDQSVSSHVDRENGAKSELKSLVAHIIKTKTMSLKEQLRVHQICDSISALSVEDYMSLDLLRELLAAGKIQAPTQKYIYNVMEQIIKEEVLSQLLAIDVENITSLDIGDIQAYALNRLPSLYATTEEGLSYQRQIAYKRLSDDIQQEVKKAIYTIIERQTPFSERTPLTKDRCDSYEQTSTDCLRLKDS